jgi:hypothetical protein
MRLPVDCGSLISRSVQVSVVGPAAIRLSISTPSADVMKTTGIVIGVAPATVMVPRPGTLL